MAEYKRVDWEAVKRDYRTSRFTQAELCAKHEIADATLSRKLKKDRAVDPDSWPQDLSAAVRQATNARVMAEMVKTEINDGQELVKDAVKSAAEIGANVILSHQRRLKRLHEDAERARDLLVRMSDSIGDMREAQTFVNAIEASARTAKIIIEAERKVFNLDDDDEKGDKGAVTVNITRFSDA